jgi:hypothetical protein
MFALTACGGGGTGDPPRADAAVATDAGPSDASAACIEATHHDDFAYVRDQVFAKSCFFQTSCHNANPNAPADLTLTQIRAYGELVDTPSTEVPTMMRVAPGSCEDSYLYAKITGTFDIIATDKDPMPPTFTQSGRWVPICQEKVDAICRWIARGAPEQEPDAGPPDAGPADAGPADAAPADATPADAAPGLR